MNICYKSRTENKNDNVIAVETTIFISVAINLITASAPITIIISLTGLIMAQLISVVIIVLSYESNNSVRIPIIIIIIIIISGPMVRVSIVPSIFAAIVGQFGGPSSRTIITN